MRDVVLCVQDRGFDDAGPAVRHWVHFQAQLAVLGAVAMTIGDLIRSDIQQEGKFLSLALPEDVVFGPGVERTSISS